VPSLGQLAWCEARFRAITVDLGAMGAPTFDAVFLGVGERLVRLSVDGSEADEDQKDCCDHDVFVSERSNDVFESGSIISYLHTFVKFFKLFL